MSPAPVREDPDWVKGAVAARVHYRVPGMDQVTVQRDLSYKTVAGDTLLFDYYAPLQPLAVPSPVVILIHGGPIPGNLRTSPKQWGNFDSLGRVIAASGLGAVMFNHRFFALEMVRDAIEDVHGLIAALPSYAGRLGIDPARLCLWVFSGGGVLLSPFLRETPDAVRCLAAYYAPLDASLPEFSPAQQLAGNTGRVPPMLIARAGLDMPPLNATIDAFVVEALKKNARIDVLNHPHGQHAFDCRDDHARTRDILRRTLEFIALNI